MSWTIGGGDHIRATGIITKLDGFLTLSPKQRKQLVSETLQLIKVHLRILETLLVDKETGQMTGRNLENHHIILNVILRYLRLNDKKEDICLSLPSQIGPGQAGYKDGEFVFSETYFITLKVVDGIAVSGDPNKFVIESE